jgi:hypothetical protein
MMGSVIFYDGSEEVALASSFSPSQEHLLHHRRLGHLYFAALSCVYPSFFKLSTIILGV